MIAPRAPEREAELAYRPCAGIVLARADGLVFAGRRIDRPEATWQMPQGGIDAGETVEAAALRELQEETGVLPSMVRVERTASGSSTYEVPPDRAPAHWKGRWRGQAVTWVLLRFLGTDADVHVATSHAEFSDWRWAPLPEIAEGIVVWKRSVYARAIEEFGKTP